MRLGGRRAIGPFDDELRLDVGRILSGDLIFERRRNGVFGALVVGDAGHLDESGVALSRLVGDHFREHGLRVATTTGPEGEAVVTIEDTGKGIAPELLARVFDPYFSTRSAGVGVGLGLAVAREVIASAGGRIEVEGARFTLVVKELSMSARRTGP